MSHAAKHYNTLGVRQNASAAIVRQAHHHWLTNLHPWAEEDADERWARQQVLDRINNAVNAVSRTRRPSKRRRAH